MTDEEPTVVTLIEILGVYDGTSVYEMSDGTFVNRWAKALEQWPNDKGVQRRYERTEDWINKHLRKEGDEQSEENPRAHGQES